MLCIIETSTDPYFNLAAEEYLLKEFTQPVFRLWRNNNAIIVGRYQNSLAEINTEYVREHKIKVVRRLTGGGAVYHDLGNINYTFIERQRTGEDSTAMFKRFTAPILEALQKLGVDAKLEGRNDLVIGGAKFSGNAIALYKKRILQHGTLLFSSHVGSIYEALKEKEELYKGRAVQSKRREVTNISSHLNSKMEVEDFIKYLSGYLKNYICAKGEPFTLYRYTEEDLKAINTLRLSKYKSYEWNYGASPEYQFTNKRRFKGGTIELFFNVKEGRITTLKIFGDYFFTKPTEEFCAALIGTPHRMEALLEKINSAGAEEYFNNITPTALAELFFN